jgi:hypothetical protein
MKVRLLDLHAIMLIIVARADDEKLNEMKKKEMGRSEHIFRSGKDVEAFTRRSGILGSRVIELALEPEALGAFGGVIYLNDIARMEMSIKWAAFLVIFAQMLAINADA